MVVKRTTQHDVVRALFRRGAVGEGRAVVLFAKKFQRACVFEWSDVVFTAQHAGSGLFKGQQVAQHVKRDGR